jgi:hypothetical protein
MRMIGFLSFGVYVVAFVFGVYFSLQATDTFDDFIKLLTPYVAAISAMLAAVVAYINVTRQTKLAFKLEQVKTDLSKDVEELKADLTKEVEELKAELTKYVELVKAILAAESVAFGELTQAMNAFYFAIAKVEEGKFDAAVAEGGDGAMAMAEYQLMRLSEDCRVAYRTIWQELHVAREKFISTPSNDDRVAYWKSRKSRVENLQKEFEDSFRKQQKNH